VRAKIKSLPKHGTAGFEARLERDKLTSIERDVLAQKKALEHKQAQGRSLADAIDGDTALGLQLDRELLQIEEQLDYHAERLQSHSPGEGYVAAEGGQKRDYAIQVNDLKPGEVFENEKEISYSLDAMMPNGHEHSVITISFPKDGSPANMVLANDPRVDGETLGIRLQDGSRAVSITDYAIKKAEQFHQEKFGKPLTELGGSLADDNKVNFYMEYLEARERGAGHEDGLLTAATNISYGQHRSANGFSNLEVKATGELPPLEGTDIGVKIKNKQRDSNHRRNAQIRDLDYAALARKYGLPKHVSLIGRKP
jgi:hypothetical protein